MSEQVTDYTALELYDADEQTLYDTAISAAVTKFPDWTPREGNTEVVLLESQALITAELVYAVNRLPDAVLEALLGLYGLTRDPGTPPAAAFTFTSTAAGPVTIPLGTRLRLLYGDDEAVEFTTDTALVFTGSGTVTGTAEENTDALNGVPAGATVELVDALAVVDTVALSGAVTGGVNPEDGYTYRARGATLLRRLVSTLVLPEHFTAAALENPAVNRAVTVDLFNPDAGTGAPGDHPGHVTVAVAGTGGTVLDPATKTTIAGDLEAKALASLVVHVTDPSYVDVDVTATLIPSPGADPATVTAAATTALGDYLNPDTWPADQTTVYRNELIALLSNVTGVDRVADLTTPAADVTLTGVAALPRPGTLTLTTA